MKNGSGIWGISNPASADAGAVFAWRDGVASPAGKPGKPPGEAPNNHLRRCVTFAGHFARNTNRISNILRVI